MTKYSKFIAALIAAAGEAVALGLFDARALAIIIAFVGAYGVYKAPNTEPTIDIAARLRGDRAQTWVPGLVVVILLVVIILLATGRL